MTIQFFVQLVSIIILAAIPIFLWLWMWLGNKSSQIVKKYSAMAFLLGCFSVLPVLLIHYIWDKYPDVNIIGFISLSNLPVSEKLIILFVILAFVEEMAKFLMVFFLDKSKKLIQSIHDAIMYGVVVGLGFAFAENMYFFLTVGYGMKVHEFLALFSFRSLITVCGHLVFSGLFGNYYGISKFAKVFASQKHWRNFRKNDKRELNDQQLQYATLKFAIGAIGKGLFFAVSIHALFNYFLQKEMVTNLLFLLALSFFYLIYLYRQRSGYLGLLYRRSKISHMRDRDKDVVLELLGLWYEQEKYLQVIATCKRLLKKNPDNPVVLLFLSKAIDNQRFVDAFTAIKNLFVPKDYLDDLNNIDDPEGKK
jgi:RsiW-degrading membrane proteinase PrsW (M82 family)